MLNQPQVISDDQLPEWWRAVSTGFGFSRVDDIGVELTVLDPSRCIGMFDAEHVVATASAYNFGLIVPGGAEVPTAGVTQVTVSPTHRRQGRLRALMEHQLDDVARRGEPLAVLTASEGSIYRRFGYGVATETTTVTIDSRTPFTWLAEPDRSGRFRFALGDERADELAPLFAELQRGQTGAITRSLPWWQLLLGRQRNYKGGNSPFAVVHETAGGRADGLIVYNVGQALGTGGTGNVEVHDLIGATPEIEALLWEYAASVDLCDTVHRVRAPLTDTLRRRLVDPRLVKIDEVRDDIWLRIVDVEAAMNARTFADVDPVVLDVADPFRPATSGRYEVGVSGARRVEPNAGAAVDLSLDIADLGAVYLGGVTFRDLDASGLLAIHQPEAVERADALFATETMPHTGLRF